MHTATRTPLRLLAAAALALALVAATAGTAGAETTQDYVVVLDEGASLRQEIATQESAGNAVTKTFAGALDGFVVSLTPAEAAALRADDATAIVEPNQAVSIAAAPANDAFAAAQSLGNPGAASGSLGASTAEASKEPGEPVHGAPNVPSNNASIWYRWVAPATGTLTVSTAGSGFDTVLALYTGTSLNALAAVASNDDYGGTLQSRITPTVTAGTTYWLAVDGYTTSRGAVALTWSLQVTSGAIAPGAPTGATAVAGDRRLTASWVEPTSNGGAAISRYTATAAPGGASCTATYPTRTCAITGLANGTAYTVTVTATNAAGTSTASSPSAAVTPFVPGVPGAPTGVLARARNGALGVEWTAPAADGGSAITGYTATAAPGGASCTAATTACVITGLANGTPYTVTVRATNAIGTGAASAPSAAVAPAPVAIARDIATPAWGIDRLDQRALPLDGRIVQAGIGSGVSAYVIDTGVRPDHEQLGGRVGAGYTAISDGQGTNDCHGHGTHVAGTVAGTTVGVAPGATVLPVRVLDCNGSGSSAGVIAGINWMIANHQAGVPAVANMSLGGTYSAALNAAVAAASADGIAMVVAAGNSDADACSASPASEPTAITVGATDSADRRAYFSNWGSCVDVFAPGVSILSASAGSTTGLAPMSGTSMAAPHTAGAAAVLLSLGYTSANVATGITGNATSGIVGDPAGSPNLLLSLAGVTDAPATQPGTPPAPTPTPTPAPAPTPTPAPGTTPTPTPPPSTSPATLTRVRVIFRALRGRSNRGSYIVTGQVSHDGTIVATITLPALRPGGSPVVMTLTYDVAAGPFAVATQPLRRGGSVQLRYTPDDPALDPVITNPGVERVVQGTQTHLPAKTRPKRS